MNIQHWVVVLVVNLEFSLIVNFVQPVSASPCVRNTRCYVTGNTTQFYVRGSPVLYQNCVSCLSHKSLSLGACWLLEERPPTLCCSKVES